ncbi:MAG: cation:proton antiporter, partial [Propionicimonas sp.]|nr:cation:proton antiporter [Propionicimonas sp.]
METALLISIAGIVLVVAITAFAPKFGVAPPLILVVLGTAISFLPNLPPIEIEPEWILGGLLPPLLFSAAVNIPSMEFRRDLSLISGFSVLLVIVSALVVGVLLTWLIPGLPLALGIAVGAIVSPTDAVATSIVKKAGVST